MGYHGFPSSFSWVLLGIFYLQRVGLLGCQPSRQKVNSHKPQGQSLRSLLAGFFAFCGAALRNRWRGISVEKGDFVKLSEPTQVLFVEVPGEPSHNAARCLRP